MSKPIAGFHGQKSIGQSSQPKPKEYRVLGVNQPLIAPESEQVGEPEKQTLATSSKKSRFNLSLLLNKLL
jgi:hypothetical protein